LQKGKEKKKEKPRYHHYHKPYRKIGKIPEKALDEVKSLLLNLCEGMPGIGSFGTSGTHELSDGAIGFDLRLDVLRMEHNSEAQNLIKEAAKKYDIPWLVKELLERKTEDNLFIISLDGELHAIVW